MCDGRDSADGSFGGNASGDATCAAGAVGVGVGSFVRAVAAAAAAVAGAAGSAGNVGAAADAAAAAAADTAASAFG